MLGTKTVSWSSKKQSTNSVVIDKAEYKSLVKCYLWSDVVEEAIGWFTDKYGDFILCSDSMTAIYLAKNNDQVADIFTKFLDS